MPKSTNKIYLDYASSALSVSANPSSIHEFGVKERNKLEQARKCVAEILKVNSSEIIFTSGATESNNLAILGLVREQQKQNSLPIHIITTNIEHASVLETYRYLEKTKQVMVTYVEVEPSGIIDPKKIKKALTKNTVLVSVMYANNEIGTVQPIKEIAKEIRHFNKINNTKIRHDAKQVFFHTDATQAMNYLPITVPQLGVDMMSFNASKIYGPKGIGVLCIKKNTPITNILFGGDQEMGLRPGTENVASAEALAKALEQAEKMKQKELKRLTVIRDYFIKKLEKLGEQIIINGELKHRLPNNINITIPNIPSDLLVVELSAKGIMASAKSACKSGDGKASHVIEAIHKGVKETDGSLRFSLGRETTKADIDYTTKSLFHILQKLRKWYS